MEGDEGARGGDERCGGGEGGEGEEEYKALEHHGAGRR